MTKPRGTPTVMGAWAPQGGGVGGWGGGHVFLKRRGQSIICPPHFLNDFY